MSNARVLSKVPNTALAIPIGTSYTLGEIATTNHLSTNAGSIGFGINDGGGAYSGVFVNNTYSAPYSSQDIRFYTAQGGVSVTTERVRIDPAGNLLVGTTVTSALQNNNSLVIRAVGDTTQNHASGTASGSGYLFFGYNGGAIGSITQSGTTGVLYNITSDYRLKNDVAPIKDALATIEALNPVSFTWIDGRPDDGFIAHELQAVLPNCVTGEKDAVNEDGSPKYQQMDNSGVIPFLVKAIQELKAEVDSLKAQLG